MLGRPPVRPSRNVGVWLCRPLRLRGGLPQSGMEVGVFEAVITASGADPRAAGDAAEEVLGHVPAPLLSLVLVEEIGELPELVALAGRGRRGRRRGGVPPRIDTGRISSFSFPGRT